MVGGEGDDQQGAIAGCQRGGVPLLGAVVGCHCSVLRLGGGGLGEWTWCHYMVGVEG